MHIKSKIIFKQNILNFFILRKFKPINTLQTSTLRISPRLKFAQKQTINTPKEFLMTIPTAIKQPPPYEKQTFNYCQNILLLINMLHMPFCCCRHRCCICLYLLLVSHYDHPTSIVIAHFHW